METEPKATAPHLDSTRFLKRPHVRERVLSAPKTRAIRRPPIEQKLLAQLLGQLGRVGGNIHQIVKQMNFGTGVMHDELRSALKSFEGAAAAIMDAMGRGQR